MSRLAEQLIDSIIDEGTDEAKSPAALIKRLAKKYSGNASVDKDMQDAEIDFDDKSNAAKFVKDLDAASSKFSALSVDPPKKIKGRFVVQSEWA